MGAHFCINCFLTFKGHYSTITLILEVVDEGTLIKVTHVDVPEGAYESVKEGWYTYYWDPLRALLEKY